MRAITTVGAGALAVLLWAAPAGASPPVKARVLQGDFVTASEPCETPDVATDAGVPACSAVRADPVCGFGPNGSGKFKLKVKGGSLASPVRVIGRLRGLDPACVGADLMFEVSARFTGEVCQGSACTAEDFTAPLAHCIVDARLRCEFGPLAPILEPLPPPPAGEYAVLGARVVRNTSGRPRVFDAGFLLAEP